MRQLLLFLLLILLVAGGAIGFFVFRQLDTKTVTLAAALQMRPGDNTAPCGYAELDVNARTLARWSLPLAEGQAASLTVSVAGDERADIGLRITSPNNRTVFSPPDRFHELSFALGDTIRGDYTFQLDNRHSAFTEKRVTVSVCFA